MHYVLYNSNNERYLTHPLVGLWSTDDKEEAEEMLRLCHAYLRSYQFDFMIDHIIVKEVKEEQWTGNLD